ILQGNFSDHLAFYGLPLYPYLLALIYKLAGYGPFIPGLLQAGPDAGTALILYKLGSRIFGARNDADTARSEPARRGGGAPFWSTIFLHRGEVIGIIAAMGWAFFAPAQAYAVILMPTAG